VNLHDAAGVQPHEQMYEPFTVANGEDPSLNKTVPYNVTSKLYMYTLSDIVLKPLMDDGVDFMWIDWQQVLVVCCCCVCVCVCVCVCM